ncbi:unnamed protein product [Cyprideis torosa]|uniref:Alpha-mannosidase n=1 Tax=Cyprideis torosa TaxID=163714 RepID=A0A7R8W705_9CRUS|nr:unnamed protein product [Cyprideis torosa]CAG0887055.1 unnamed protein product [Cyprideis torosa]
MDRVVSNADGSFLIKNKILEAIIEPTGKVRSLVHRRSGRNGIAEGSFANELCLYEDIPLFWDAWDVMDYHLETRVVLNESTVAGKMVTSLEKIQLIEDTSLRKVLGWKMVFGEARSVLKQQIVLEVSSPVLVFESEVEWKETHRLLKVESSFDILTREVYYDSQFGHIARPNHSNTSWDAAKYEVVGHKWAAVSEANFGAAVLSDSKYGWNGNGKKLSLSLLRSPKNPDGNADMGSHSFRHGLFLFDGTFQSSGLIRVGFEFNVAVQKWINACCVPVGESFLVSSNPAVVIDTVKPAQNFAQRAIVLRCYEAFGGKNTTRSPKNPDGNADMGSHLFRHGLFLFDGTFQSSGLIRVGFEFNVAVQKWINAGCVPVGESFLVSSNPAVVIDTVKPAQNFAQRAIVLRCYEAFGGKNTTRISLGFGVGSIRECNGMEEIIDNEPIKAEYRGGTSQPTFSAIFKPFQIKSYIIKLP